MYNMYHVYIFASYTYKMIRKLKVECFFFMFTGFSFPTFCYDINEFINAYILHLKRSDSIKPHKNCTTVSSSFIPSWHNRKYSYVVECKINKIFISLVLFCFVFFYCYYYCIHMFIIYIYILYTSKKSNNSYNEQRRIQNILTLKKHYT